MPTLSPVRLRSGFSRRAAPATLSCLLMLGSSSASAQFGGDGAGGGGVGGDLTKFVKELQLMPAVPVPSPTRADLLAAASAGKRVVAVGDHGVVVLSDDNGRTWRQSREVPVRVLLTSVAFVDEKRGWAAGHWGVVLHTEDGGETWKVQRQDSSVDQPLFSIYFTSPTNGLAVGLWSLALSTSDGGTTWNPIKMPVPRDAGKAGPNLYQIFPGADDRLYIAAESGLVYVSDNGGTAWSMIDTGNRGSLWTGVCLKDGSLLVAGLNGKILRSGDKAKTWTPLQSGVIGSITDLVQAPDGSVIGVGLEGAFVRSANGSAFKPESRADRSSLTAVLVTTQGTPLLFSEDGVVQEN